MPSDFRVGLGALLFAVGAVVGASNGTDDASLFWGTYRPNLYFGLRPQVPLSLMTGLMWFGTQDYTSFNRTTVYYLLLCRWPDIIPQRCGILAKRVMA